MVNHSIKFMLIFSLILFHAITNQALAEDKPFADTNIILQISDADSGKQALVLNVASQLIKNVGVDKANIEIVAFGPGLSMLLASSSNSKRVKTLAENGINFTACSSTQKALSKKLGHPIKINKAVTKSEPGVVRIANLVRQGYVLIKP